MKFHGFNSISQYEQACRENGFTTRRIPCLLNGAPANDYFILETKLINGSESSISTWHLFTSDETNEIMNGVFNGIDEKRLIKVGIVPSDLLDTYTDRKWY